MGDICQIYNGESGGQVLAEVVGFKNDRMLLMPYSDMSGISSGNFVRNTGRRLSLMRVLPYSSANAFKIRSPVSPLFSGWNWVPYTLPARTAPVTGME